MKKVLIVDDEPDIVDMVSLVLEDQGLNLLTAYDGEQALRLALQEHPDLLLTDVMMPRLDGRELCARLKSDPSMSGTTVVLMSAMLNLDPNGCQAAALVRKPFDIALLADTVTGLLGRTPH
ncbi:MAG: response regulator [Chloroflexota bacterium]|nr:response regulator [Chloroflexota bacterium]